MNRKIVMAALAALAVPASSAPALAQWGGPGFSVGVGFGDNGWNGGYYGDYGYSRRPGVGVSVGFGSSGWGYDDGYYGSYAAAPSYGCSCANRYRTTRVAPRYGSSYAYGSYPSDYTYDDNYYGGSYGGSYASVGFGWNDDGWRNRRIRRDDRRSVRFDRGDRVRADVSFGDRERRTEFSGRTGGDVRVRGNGEFRSGMGGEIRARGNGEVRSEIRGTSGRGNGMAMRAGSNSRRGGDETR